MIIKSIELNNFRNYEVANIEFDKNINILYGDNAQGKTNLLEACYYSAISKSFKSTKDKEIIRFGQDYLSIKTIIDKNDREYAIDISINNNKKTIKVDNVKINYFPQKI